MQNILKGKFGHRYEDNAITWQGRILGQVQDTRYLVQLYSWIDGDETDQVLVPIEQLDNWKFYDTEEDWKRAYDKYRQHP